MSRVVKAVGKPAERLKMHGSGAERKLAGGLGALIKWSGDKVPVTGDKPGKQQRRKP